jgi:PTH1 family peptidyl-tRNA hydrolase
MYLVVGLGNPGRKYERTRHNAGFDAVELLAKKLGIRLSKLKCKALIGEGKLSGERLALAQPQTFMNLSGESVSALISWYKIEPAQLIVVYDDCDLPLGHLRVRERGSAGTHNGMRSILYQLGRDDFPRVRIGIGRPPEGWDLADYVLTGYPTAEEQKTAYDALIKAGETIEKIVVEGVPKASELANAWSKECPT